MSMKTCLVALLAGALALAAPFADAQQKTQRIRGTITGVDGNVLSVKSREGKDLKVELTEKASVATAKAITLADLKQGTYVGVTTKKQGDALVAVEVHTLPPTAKPGYYPWDLAPDTMMTNANLASVAQVSGGQHLVVEMKEGKQTILVPPGTPIVTATPADRSALKAGEYVFFNADVGADGKYSTSARIQVSHGGVKPPQ
jgi:hypothetical protein